MLFLFVLLLLVLTGCTSNTGNQSKDTHNSSSSIQTSASSRKENKQRQAIKITVNGTILRAHLNDSTAGRAFASELPVTLVFRNFMNMPEKIADLHHRLLLLVCQLVMLVLPEQLVTGHLIAGLFFYWGD